MELALYAALVALVALVGLPHLALVWIKGALALRRNRPYVLGFFDGGLFGMGKTTSADVCVPGTPGLLGDPCLADAECGAKLCEKSGLSSGPGFCSQAGSSTCPGSNSVCTPIDGTKRCVETCWGQDACSVGLACEDGVPRAAGGTRRACVPGE